MITIILQMPSAETSPTTLPEAGEQPFRVFITKTASGCNLNCDYCYMYNMADDSWNLQPPIMDDDVIQATAARVAENAAEHDLPWTLVAFHGGEPVLADKKDPTYYERATEAFKREMYDARGQQTELYFGMQTNGTLLNRDNLERFRRLGIGVGVSIDGNIDTHDRHRRYANGRGSFRDTLRGLTLLREYPEIQSTILNVIDLEADPLRTYKNLSAFGTKAVEFLLPLASRTSPPPESDTWGGPTPYADWLLPIFKAWNKTLSRERPSIPLFEETINLIAGKKATLEYIGGTLSDNIVVETNGEIEDTDTLKAVAAGITKLGLNVFDNSFTEALRHPKIRQRQLGRAALSEQCLSCGIVDVCGGGYYVHRYEQGSNNGDEFRNPSVYCDDLYKMIVQILSTKINERHADIAMQEFFESLPRPY